MLDNCGHVLCIVTCECGGLGHGAVLVLCGNDTGSRAEDWRGQEWQLFNDAAAARVVFRQLAETLLQGISQEVELLAGLVKTSLGLERRRGNESEKDGINYMLNFTLGENSSSVQISFILKSMRILFLLVWNWFDWGMWFLHAHTHTY